MIDCSCSYIRGLLHFEGHPRHVDGVQYRTIIGTAKSLQVAVAVPIHHRYGVAASHTRVGKATRELADPLAQATIIETRELAVDDLKMFAKLAVP